MRTGFIILTLIILQGFTKAQETDSSEIREKIMEMMYEPDTEEDFSDITDYIESFEAVNINSAGIQELSAIPFINHQDVLRIINYREKHGPFFSVYELFMIKEFNEDKVRMIIPFITIDQDAKTENPFELKNLSVRNRIRKKDLEDKTENSWSLYNRLKLTLSSAEIGLLNEKDEGENRFDDFYSGYISFNNSVIPGRVTAGDFNIEEGQGLLFWGSYGTPKNSLAVSSVRKNGRGLVNYSSSNEVSFLRGIAAEIPFSDNFSVIGFFSSRFKDSVFDSAKREFKIIKDGYHRTDSEIARKNNLLVKSGGGIFKYSDNVISTAFSFHTSEFGNFHHKHSGASLSADAQFKNVVLFNETAYADDFAIITGIQFSPVKAVDFITLYRNYGSGYRNLYGFGFGERNGLNRNETGFYTGLKISTPTGVVNTYFDQYSFGYEDQLNTGRSGFDFLIMMERKIKKNIGLQVRYKIENKEEPAASDYFRQTEKRIRESIRSEFSITEASLVLRTRLEAIKTFKRDEINETGILLMQEVKYSPVKELSCSFRISFFRTESFNSAIYLYEYAAPGVMDNNIFYGEGIHYSANIKGAIKGFPIVYLKYGYRDKADVSGRRGPELLIQVEFKY
jgi:hypothetical protein